jgi:phage terminase small subunit
MSKRKDQRMGMDIAPNKTGHLSTVLDTADDDLRSDKQTSFVREYPKDWNGTQAAIRAGYSEATACEQASRLLSKANVRAAIDRRISQIAALAEVDAAMLTRELLDGATADPRELVSVHRDCCRWCHGIENLYQWTAGEYRLALDTALRDGKPAPEMQGGFGFDCTLEPLPNCPECRGRGVESVIVADTRKLSGKAAKLYAGAVATKDGIKVLVREQTAALDRLCRIAGLYVDKKEISGPGGGAIQLQPVPADPSTLSNEELRDILKRNGHKLIEGATHG